MVDHYIDRRGFEEADRLVRHYRLMIRMRETLAGDRKLRYRPWVDIRPYGTVVDVVNDFRFNGL